MTQKVWKQIGLYNHIWNKLDFFMQENAITTEGAAIQELLLQNTRFKSVMSELEKAANEGEQWKARAQAHIIKERKKDEAVKKLVE